MKLILLLTSITLALAGLLQIPFLAVTLAGVLCCCLVRECAVRYRLRRSAPHLKLAVDLGRKLQAFRFWDVVLRIIDRQAARSPAAECARRLALQAGQALQAGRYAEAAQKLQAAHDQQTNAVAENH